VQRVLTPPWLRRRAFRRGTGFRRVWGFAAVGGAFGLLAPLGLLLFRSLQLGEPVQTMVSAELRADWPVYVYLTASSALAYSVFGGALGLLNDIDRRVSLVDPLTGLPNRRHLLLLLEHDLAHADRRGEDLALLLVDVDGLKQINDAGGHPAGDHALRCVARAMRTVCRPSDLPARIGGDEFAILATGADTVEGRGLAERLRKGLADEPGAPRVSVGVASLSRARVPDAEALFTAADEALYEAKEGGRDRVVEAAPRPD
jgi:diguanylate cyclase (GGDEF)-like protein